jgi:hypothetical protein
LKFLNLILVLALLSSFVHAQNSEGPIEEISLDVTFAKKVTSTSKYLVNLDHSNPKRVLLEYKFPDEYQKKEFFFLDDKGKPKSVVRYHPNADGESLSMYSELDNEKVLNSNTSCVYSDSKKKDFSCITTNKDLCDHLQKVYEGEEQRAQLLNVLAGPVKIPTDIIESLKATEKENFEKLQEFLKKVKPDSNIAMTSQLSTETDSKEIRNMFQVCSFIKSVNPPSVEVETVSPLKKKPDSAVHQ